MTILCVSAPGTTLAADEVLWDIGSAGRFDGTNQAYAIQDERVSVDLRREDTRCPTGLGHLASGRPTVREIHLLFAATKRETAWLHITWNPGGSGTEQFEAICNGIAVGRSERIDATTAPDQDHDERFSLTLGAGKNTIVLRFLSGDGLRFSQITLATTEAKPQIRTLKPTLKYPTLAAFEQAIGEPALLLDSEHVCFFAPKRREQAARIVFPYLERAYTELYGIVGVHTKYKVAVYAFPKGHADGWGGTGECAIEYSDENLILEASEEWTRHKVPHVSGFIEEMAHNFVSAAGVQFGWEMVGWSLGVAVTTMIADNPIFQRALRDTRRGQAETYRRYRAAKNTFPADLPPNQCDRIHAYLLHQCERKYGSRFWPNFFKATRARQKDLAATAAIGDSDERRNARYQITIECFEQLEGVDFKGLLRESGISLTTDVKSLYPEKPGWNRKLQ